MTAIAVVGVRGNLGKARDAAGQGGSSTPVLAFSANEDVVNAFVVAMACYSLYMLCPHDTNLLGLSFAGLCRYRGKVCTGVAPNKSLWIFGRVVGAR